MKYRKKKFTKFKKRAIDLPDALEKVQKKVEAEERLDQLFGYEWFKDTSLTKLGFALTICPTTIQDKDSGIPMSAVGIYFLANDGTNFKVAVPFEPYFFIYVKEKYRAEVEDHLKRQFSQEITHIEPVSKEDLDLNNHLSGKRETFLKVSFRTVQALISVRYKIAPRVKKNKARAGVEETYSEMHKGSAFHEQHQAQKDLMDFILDIREYDVPYYIRFAIDKGIRCGYWYEVSFRNSVYQLKARDDILERAQPKVFAFDIETTHAPLRFPDAETDSVTMISYMLDQQGYLIVNRSIVSEDIQDFEYTPKPEFKGNFIVFNEPTEDAVLRRFFTEIRRERPHVFVSFNGDGFDWPFLETRARVHGMSMQEEIGVFTMFESEVYTCHYASHLDCFKWVVRDSYLPVGSQGLKAVTKAKLGYDPLELDPEDMVRFATERPQELAAYSVSDAVCTFFLYKNYVHPFIYSLCTIIPMNPDDVLRKGSGTLCESLLMVQAFDANVIFPNKKERALNQMHNGHLVESETYIGGHVESLQAGVFRSDIPMKFKLDPTAFSELAGHLESTMRFAVEIEAKQRVEDCENLLEVEKAIRAELQALEERPEREELPMIYHLDVGAMYPNIILTNRLQPSAVVDETVCAACDFNKPENECQKRLNWQWRGELFPCTRSEFELVKSQLESERFPHPNNKERMVSYFDLPETNRDTKLKSRLKDYCRRVYRRNHDTITELREDTVCMRENSFYVDTVRLFRDRRYEYKASLAHWKRERKKAEQENDHAARRKAEEMVVVFDSLQVAHKCILNSFYGYVMRRGARWYSMEMAGMVAHTGAEIIRETRVLVERIGIALELDTDGIWCCLPSSLPEEHTLRFKNGKTFKFDYSCVVLNHMVARDFTNHQYQELVGPKQYITRTENSIFFELDGPYRCMFLPSASEEGKTLKKRYAVFRMDGSLAELKGFELKRRGELKLIKAFQAEVFSAFLNGDSLTSCYSSVASVADHWLDVLHSKGAELEDEELLELLSSSSNMSKALHEYGDGKSNAITTARRLGEFLGPQIVAEKGLSCRFVISKEPASLSITERAIPTIIFSAEPNTRNHFIRKWIKDTARMYDDYSIRDILDWDYYIGRFETTCHKIVTIPAAMQGIDNPLPRVRDPEWLRKRRREEADPHKQVKISSMFKTVQKPVMMDIENLALQTWHSPAKAKRTRDFPVEEEPLPEVEAMMQDEDEEDETDAEEPDRTQDYTAWLKWQKAMWKRKRQARASDSKRGRANQEGAYTAHTYAEKERFRYAREPWRVLQVLPTESAGEFNVWVLMEGRMQKVRVLQDRVLYVNSSSQAPANEYGWQVQAVERTLPRSKPSLNLYEIRLPERTFQRNFKQLIEAFTSADVAGVYGARVTLDFNLLVELGSVCSVIPETVSDELPAGTFRLTQLERRSTHDVPYVTDGDVAQVLLYHSYNRDRTKAAYGLFLPGEPVQVALVDAQRLDMQALSEVMHRKDPNTRFEFKKSSRINVGAAHVNKLLQEYRIEKMGEPAMVVVQTTLSDEQLRADLPELENFPIIRASANLQDNAYERRTNWAQFALNCMVQRAAHLREWLPKQLEFAGYGQVPVGNFASGLPGLVSDISFTRLLHDHHFISWGADGTRPDLGGTEEDNNVLVDIENPAIERPGCYDTVCIELNVQHLAINSIMQSHLVHSAEGALGVGVGQHQQGDQARDVFFEAFDDTSDCLPAFNALRSLVLKWTADIGESAEQYNEWAELLLNNVYNWLSSPSSKLYDPTLHKFVHLLMRKVFLQLLQGLRKLGSRVVHADFNKIIIVTTKHTLEDAQAYWNYIQKSINKQELFAWMSIEPECYWEVLLYLGPTDYGGVRDGKPVSAWNLAEYLPQAAHDTFLVTTTEYVLDLARFMAKQHGESGEAELKRLKSSNTEIIESREQLVGTELSQKLLRAVQEMHSNPLYQQQHDQVRATMPGASNTHESPAVQFVVSICRVLALDSHVDQPVANLRKNLLRLVGVDDFSPEAEFKHPCRSYTLNDVICTYCAAPRSLDMLRDPQLLAHDWSCPVCQQQVDKAHIEALLVDALYAKSYQYQAQDFICSKCTLVKESNMHDMCPDCSGTFKCRLTAEEMGDFVSTLGDVARYHRLEWMSQVVNQFQQIQ